MIYYSSYSQIPSVTDSVKLFAPYNSYQKQIIDYLELDYLPSFYTYWLSRFSAFCTPFLHSVMHRIAYCTISEIFSICNEHTGGNSIDTPFYTGVENIMSIASYHSSISPRAQEQAFSGRNGKPCHLGSARSGRHARSLRPTQNIKDLGK